MSAERDLDKAREAELDALIEQWTRACDCDVCDRYRKSFAHIAGQYAARIEEQLRRRPA